MAVALSGLLATMGGMALGAGAGATPAEPAADAGDKVSHEVAQALDADGQATFLVRFADRPDLDALAEIEDWDARGEAVHRELRATAAASQRQARADLDAAHTAYTPFFISNAILVKHGDAELVSTLAADPEVEGIYPNTAYEIPTPVEEPAVVGPTAVEWGVADVNADDVWSQFGLTGEDIVVANIDTGVDYEHPALVNQYRGNNGDGTFDHNYNWFDAAGTGSDEPWDFDAHGTHTMGTMVGDDGGEHQIGVAPGATWIAANGCCPSDEALILSGEWMLAPTDLTGENPDASMRPHIINNSWGTTAPSNDPFMEDVAEAWAASGIFGVWANGNIGPGCETSGSPGSRIINYSVGNYDANHNIASSSSRGAGQDGEIKPNISAPGTAVTSSVPGGDYAAFTGTSMATPHVAGAIALLWSADPALVGDIELTKELLDGTAIDNPNDQCGGTDADNNVFGEGRLDALALLTAAPIADSGTVEGTVTDASTGDPVAGAQVLLQGERERSVRTGADGSYRVRFSSGDYTVTVSRFGYVTDTDTLTIPVDDTVTHDVALDPAPSGTLTGTVTDGGGQGWPLYARLSVQGEPTVGSYTDPETGAYELVLPAGTHTVVATAQYPGYQVGSAEVTIAEDGTVEQDFALPVDAVTCNAPGYSVVVDGITESFDGTEAPDGWTVEDLNGSGGVWVFEDPYDIPNGTGGEGNFAVVNSDFLGPDNPQDTTLVSPVVDLSAVESPAVGFNHYREDFGSSVAQVELSTDGGSTWTPLWEAAGSGAGPVLLPLGDEAGTDTQVRFHYEADWDAWWQVDDVFIGSRQCLPDGGGLVVGYVQNDSDGAGILGARVTSLENPSDVGTTRATPDDDALEDGFYWLYSALTGSTPFEASARNYGTDQQDVDVPVGDVGRADFVLGSAVLEVDPTSLETEVQLGESDSAEFTVTNNGTSPAEVTFGERNVGFEILRADGSRMTTQEVLGSAGAPVVSREADVSVAAFRDGPAPSGETAAPPRTAEEPWVDLTPLELPVLDNRVVSVEGQWYSIGGTDGFESTDAVWRYDATALEWMPVAPLPAPAQSSAVGVVGGQIVVAGGWQDGDPTDQTWLYDPASDAWTAAAGMPVPTSSSGYAVLGGQLVVVGGCTTADCFPIVDTVQSYDPAADEWTELAPLPQANAFPVCGAVGGVLACAGGIDDDGAGLADTLLYDPAEDAWADGAPAPVTVWGAAGTAANDQLVVVGGVQDDNITNATFGYDPDADTWSEFPAANEAVYRGGGACGLVRIGGDLGGFSPTDSAEQLPGFDECAESGADVPWLDLDTTEAVLEPGDSVTVLVTTDSSTVAQPGTYSGQVTISANTPVRPTPVDVAMHVSPPLTWGKVMGTAYLEACDGGQTAGDSIPINVDPVREDVGDGWLVVTNHEGDYARWFNTQVGRLRMTASLPGYRPDMHLVDLVRGDTVTQDFSMRDNACEENPEPVPPEVVRVAGVDRYDTASRISQLFPGPVDTVFVATGKDYPDALAAAASSGSQGAPVLLTHPEWLPQTTRIELQRLEPSTVVLVGGTSAVGQEVEDELAAFVPDAEVVRYAGADRYETAAIIAGDFASADVVYVATGRKFPDALAGAARAGALDGPVLLVRPDAVPDATAEQLSRLAPEQIVLLGGTQAVSADVEEALGSYGPVERVAGPTRYETAALIAQDHETSQDIFVATGQDWPDALAGAARAADTDVPVLLVKQDSIPEATWTELDRLDPGRIFLLGGTAAISEGVADQLRTLE
ncbi:cell wall-binding repeat-containing protein [Ornithinicoccus hortensis]|uniref:cell wall-binding repeat-containing protein n=1 Tax=Ornithinicoccus hortensis TaxID=82346 RepID=UPI001153000D|nr:cell wall-binding repeat-containing protein [Ornithinicoccus hortensis]